MEENQSNKKVERDFRLSSLAIANRKTVFLILAIILIGGVSSYVSMPKESFPELVIPEVYVGTMYPGGSPEFIEEKITDPFETEISGLKNIDEVTSTSVEGYSSIKVTFDFKVTPSEARRRVQDAVADARAKPGFPQLQFEPSVKELDLSDAMPIINVNLSGDYSAERLEEYAKLLEDKIELLPEISEVEIRGVPEKKMKVELDRLRMASTMVTFNDVVQAIQQENVTQPGGEILIGGRKNSVKIEGEFESAAEIDSIIVKSEFAENEVYMHEIGEVTFGEAEASSFAREFGKTVVMLDVKKRAGANILTATAGIKEIVEDRSGIPDGVKITLTNDQSNHIEESVSNLENSIIFGVILVVSVLLFFLGLRNALFVGVAIPLSMFMSFMLLDAMGVTLNIIVLFSCVLALGMLVDNGIVVVENVYRHMDEGYDAFRAARLGVGEVAWPIIASTATTLGAFVPLAFWPGMMGEFMKYLPITLIIVLGSSLFVALVINPVLTALYMKVGEPDPNRKRLLITAGITTLLGVLFVSMGIVWFGNLFFLIAILILLSLYLFRPGTEWFQKKFLPAIENYYERFLNFALRKPMTMLLGTFGLLIVSILLIGVFPPKVLFFPDNEPQYVNIFVEHPVGTDIHVTDSTAKHIESILFEEVVPKYADVYDVVKAYDSKGEPYNDTIPIIKSVISQVGKGTSDPAQGQPSTGETPHKARITVTFSQFQHRKGVMTSDIMTDIRKSLANKFPAGVRVIVDKNKNGPPQKPPIYIEVHGPGEYEQTIEFADSIRRFLALENVQGVEELRLDVETGKLELPIEIDRNIARKYGTSTYAIADQIRTALFGKDISTFKKEGETYDINLRWKPEDRDNLDNLLAQEVTFRNMQGQMVSLPINALLKSKRPTIYSTYGSVVRKDAEQTVTVFSNVTGEANPNEVVAQLKEKLEGFSDTETGKKMKAMGYTYEFTGQQEEQQKEMSFLSKALGIAVGLILLIIVTQFNSFSTPLIIVTAVFLSLIGVFIGLVTFRMEFVVMMTMIGIISLAGVVVNNAIVLIDYTNLIRKRMRREKEIDEMQQLPMGDVVSSIIEGGKTRLRPVLLTAITTVLGLIPLATGLNINFVKLFTDYDPEVFIGGDNVMFFGPMSWTIIFGLTFATFLTLVIVPVLYLLLYRLKLRVYRAFGWQLRSNL